MNEPEIGVLAMNIVLDIKLGSWAEKWAIRWRGCNKFSEFIECRTQKIPEIRLERKLYVHTRLQPVELHLNKSTVLGQRVGAKWRAHTWQACLGAFFPLFSWSLCCSKIKSH